ncbi:hypothetical protein BC826DRAFT_441778 [Russula brevipes]|nr:hypothetical protein BC826DRAFT_441778 [Russula brevipes]
MSGRPFSFISLPFTSLPCPCPPYSSSNASPTTLQSPGAGARWRARARDRWLRSMTSIDSWFWSWSSGRSESVGDEGGLLPTLWPLSSLVFFFWSSSSSAPAPSSMPGVRSYLCCTRARRATLVRGLFLAECASSEHAAGCRFSRRIRQGLRPDFSCTVSLSSPHGGQPLAWIMRPCTHTHTPWRQNTRLWRAAQLAISLTIKSPTTSEHRCMEERHKTRWGNGWT